MILAFQSMYLLPTHPIAVKADLELYADPLLSTYKAIFPVSSDQD